MLLPCLPLPGLGAQYGERDAGDDAGEDPAEAGGLVQPLGVLAQQAWPAEGAAQA